MHRIHLVELKNCLDPFIFDICIETLLQLHHIRTQIFQVQSLMTHFLTTIYVTVKLTHCILDLFNYYLIIIIFHMTITGAEIKISTMAT